MTFVTGFYKISKTNFKIQDQVQRITLKQYSKQILQMLEKWLLAGKFDIPFHFKNCVKKIA